MERVRLLRTLADGDWRKAAVFAVSLVLVVLVAMSLARLVWLVVEGPVAADDTPQAVVAAPPAQAPRYTAEMAASWRLFGDADAMPAGPQSGEDAPATSLSLQLLGTFSTGDAKLAGAVIAERGRDGELYRIGASLPGGAVLEKVEAVKVLLRRRGQLETLAFDAAPSSGAEAPAAALSAVPTPLRQSLGRPPEDDADDANPQARARELLAGLSENMRTNPEGVAAELGLRPVSSSQSSGYLVGEGTNGDVMRSLGLRPGDVVLSVNGKPLGNLRNDARLVDEVKASGEARVEIRRGAQTFTVNYPL